MRPGMDGCVQEEVPRPPQEEEFMLAQVAHMRRQLHAQQQAAAQKQARLPCGRLHCFWGDAQLHPHLNTATCASPHQVPSAVHAGV